MFKNEIHKKIFEKRFSLYQKQGYMLSNRFVATLFILASSSFLWKSSKKYITPNHIDFSQVEIKGIDADSYLLLKVAKDLYLKKHDISTSDITDRSLTRDYIFNVIIMAVTIARYGYDALQLE